MRQSWDIDYYNCEPDEYYTREYECSDCDDKNTTIKFARQCMQKIIDELYGQNEIDIPELESQLWELCDLLEYNIDLDKDIQVIRKPKTVDHEMNDWVKFNNQFLKELAL